MLFRQFQQSVHLALAAAFAVANVARDFVRAGIFLDTVRREDQQTFRPYPDQFLPYQMIADFDKGPFHRFLFNIQQFADSYGSRK